MKKYINLILNNDENIHRYAVTKCKLTSKSMTYRYNYTGWTLQIVAIFKITLLPNYKTYRKSKDSFGIVRKKGYKKLLRIIWPRAKSLSGLRWAKKTGVFILGTPTIMTVAYSEQYPKSKFW